MEQISAAKRTILLTGATGYVGGRLLPLLQQQGYQVRCLTRRPDALQAVAGPNVEVAQGDVLAADSLAAAMRGIDTAFYFVHSMGSKADFEEEDRQAAQNFADAARRAGVRRIIYLGGLGNRDKELSKHLRSRQETGDVLRSSNVQVIELRASIVIGSGSLSFEMIRALVERLPVMICPKWVRVLAQPIAIEDVLAYLLESIELPGDGSKIFEIGGPDQVSYGQIMQEYARQRGLRRLMIPVPLLTPYLSSLWLGLVTPLYARVGRKLVESLKNSTVVSNNLANTTFTVRPRSLSEAIARALVNEDREFAATRWSDALSSSGKPKRGEESDSDHAWSIRGRLRSTFPPAVAFAPDSTHRRPDRLVLRKLAVAGARFSRLAGRRRRSPQGPARSGARTGGRYAGFLASGRVRAGSFAAVAGGDESSRPSVAGVRGDRRQRAK